jgi:16S rRNA (adenine1518-N6/adenine1519-N6)-dimethyltransferase
VARIRDQLRSHGLAPSRARGQNFLSSPADARRIVDAVGVDAGDAVVEIGPGLGDLTRPLAERARRLVALEIDRGLVRALAEAKLPEHVEVREADALQADLVALGRELAPPVLLLGNLPYRVAGRLVAQLLLERELFAVYRRLGFMLQREVAERLLAAPDSAEYGVLSIWCGLFARAHAALELGPDQFVPRPKVHSSFVIFDPPSAPAGLAPEAPLEVVVRAAFRARRKMLRRALRDVVADDAGLAGALEAAGIDPSRRGETLSPQEFVRLSNALAAQLQRG